MYFRIKDILLLTALFEEKQTIS